MWSCSNKTLFRKTSDGLDLALDCSFPTLLLNIYISSPSCLFWSVILWSKHSSPHPYLILGLSKHLLSDIPVHGLSPSNASCHLNWINLLLIAYWILQLLPQIPQLDIQYSISVLTFCPIFHSWTIWRCHTIASNILLASYHQQRRVHRPTRVYRSFPMICRGEIVHNL